MTFLLIDNMRGYLGSRPPLVVFMIILAVMAVGLITFAYLVSDMSRAVVDQEYTRFIDRLSGVNFCIGGEERGSGGSASTPSTSRTSTTAGRLSGYVERMKQQMVEGQGVGYQHDEVAASFMTVPPSSISASLSSLSPSSPVVNVTIGVTVEVAATPIFQGIAGTFNTTIITTTLNASQLGRHGLDMEANVSLVLPPLVNRSHPCLHGQPGALCYRVSACLTLTAPRYFFPRSQRLDVLSESCHRWEPELWGENHLQGDTILGFIRCVHNASLVHLHHVHIADRNAVIFIPDRSAVNLHLMHSSYFLFVMVISLFCYTIIKGRPAKIKAVHIQSSADKYSLIQA